MTGKGLLVCGLTLFVVFSAVNAGFQEDCLEAHNYYRRLHGVPDLVLDSAVQSWAQNWADYLSANDKFEHRPNNKYGENLYAVWGSGPITPDAKAAVKAWYDEIQYYDYNNPGFSMQTGHFTQVVWKNSKRLGCAYALKNNKIVVVANYDPPGNYLGQFPENVLPLK